MPPHLHPRSTATSTLFAGTLLASFVVVGIPHIFPCPRPRTGYADTEIQFDEDGRPILRRKLVKQMVNNDNTPPAGQYTDESQQSQQQISSNISQHQFAQSKTKSHRSKGLVQAKDLSEEAALFQELQREAEALEKEARECPVPKPRGVIGRLLGFEEEDRFKQEKPSPPSSAANGAK